MNELIKMNEMKTRIEEAAREYVKNEQGINSEICHAVGNINKLEKLISHFEEVFIAGAEFMQGEVKALEEKLRVAVEALEFSLHAAEYLYEVDKPLENGMAPMFYHTLTYEGDLEMINKTKKASEALEKIKAK